MGEGAKSPPQCGSDTRSTEKQLRLYHHLCLYSSYLLPTIQTNVPHSEPQTSSSKFWVLVRQQDNNDVWIITEVMKDSVIPQNYA